MTIKNRLELADHFRELGFKIGAEVGVFDGRYSEILCEKIPGLMLFCVDSWDVYAGYRNKAYQEMLEKAYEHTVTRLAPYNCQIIKDFSMDAVKHIMDEVLDFVYIDGNHEYSYVKDDIREWTKKVKSGGIVSGHDYYVTRAGNHGVINAVDEYVKEHGIELHTTGWDKSMPERDDRQPSWYFFKP